MYEVFSNHIRVNTWIFQKSSERKRSQPNDVFDLFKAIDRSPTFLLLGSVSQMHGFLCSDYKRKFGSFSSVFLLLYLTVITNDI